MELCVFRCVVPFGATHFFARKAKLMSISHSLRERASGIESLKVFAIILIVLSHVAQTTLKNPRVVQTIDLSHGTDNLQYLLLVFFFHFGKWGNSIFFTCSAWFLLSSDRYDKRKWFFMLFEIWVISVTILAVTFYFIKNEISATYIIKSCLPTFYGNNWYLTCYLLFYPIHPILNSIINQMDKPALFRTSITLFIIYFFFSLVGGSFFGSTIIYWITIYFVIAYSKIHLNRYTSNLRLNITVMVVSLICSIGLIVVTNELCLRYSFFKGQLNRWNVNNNPFFFTLSFSMFLIASKIELKSTVINYISSLSLLIYILHENIILRTYFRPIMINYIDTHFGYSNISFWVFVCAVLLFIISVIITALYQKMFQKYIKQASKVLYCWLRRCYLSAEQIIVSL